MEPITPSPDTSPEQNQISPEFSRENPSPILSRKPLSLWWVVVGVMFVAVVVISVWLYFLPVSREKEVGQLQQPVSSREEVNILSE